MRGKEEEILKVAETMVRKGGYRSFSFRDIATAVGVKSSSVHYYYPTKADLVGAVVVYYTNNFLSYLGEPQYLIENQKDPIKIYIAAFREALIKDKRICLCGLLGAEIDGLPSFVVKKTQEFFRRNIEWLVQAYMLRDGKERAHAKAIQTLSLLQGAMIISNGQDDITVFDNAIKILEF